MKKNKKILSLVMVLTMILGMTTGMQTAWAGGAGTISSASELYAGESGYDKAVLTIEGDTLNSTVTGVGVEIDGAVTSCDFNRDSDTQLTVSNIRKDGQALAAGDVVKFFIGSDNVQTSTTTDTFTMTVKSTRAVALDTTNPTAAKVGEAYSYTFTAVGMGYMKNYAMPTAEIPDGLTLDSDGVLSGVPTTNGYYNFTITAENMLTGSTDSHEYTLAVGDVPTISTNSVLYEGEIGYSKVLINLENDNFLPNIGAQVSFVHADGSSGGEGYGNERISDKQFAINDLSRPGGSLKAGDKVSIYFANFSLAGGTTNTNIITLTVKPTRPVTLDTTAMQETVVGASYSHTFTSIGGKGYKAYAVTSGTLPDGLSLSSYGEVSGKATTAGQYTFTITATDTATPAVSDSHEYTLDVKGKTTSGDYEYANGVIYKYNGNDENVIIPSEIDGMAITAIGEYAFKDKTIMKSVKIPNSIKTIEHGAFNGCTNIKSIVIPESVTSIERFTFGYDYNSTKLTKAIFLGDAPELGNRAFYNTAPGFKVYYLSSKSGYSADWGGYTCVAYDTTTAYNVTYDGMGNDGGTVPSDSGVYHTGDSASVLSNKPLKTGYAFNCWNTKEDGTGESYASGDVVTVGTENITLYAQWNKAYTITKDAAMQNGSISIWIDDEEVSAAPKYEWVEVKVEPAAGYRYVEGTLCYCVEGETDYYYIDDSKLGPKVKLAAAGPSKGDDSGKYGFSMRDANIVITADFELATSDYSVYKEREGYGSISKYYGSGGNIIIPSNINSVNIEGISGNAFYGTDTLTGVTLPNGLIYTGYFSFSGCTSLSAVELPDSLERIVDYSFSGCTSLNSIRIPSKVSVIGNRAFAGCSMLTSVYFEGDAPNSQDDTDSGEDSKILPPVMMSKIFDNGNSNLVLYYKEGAKGFDVAPWTDYTLKEYKYLVKYNHNGATSGIVPAEDILFADGSIQIKANSGSLVKTGYTFAGWNTKADGTGTSYNAGATVNVTGDMVLYAKWTVTSNGGNSSGGSSGGGGGSSTTPAKPITTPTAPTTPTVNKIEAKSDENGKAAVTEKQVADAVEQAQKQGDRAVTIKVDAPRDSKFVETNIPKAAITSMAENMSEGMSVATPVAEVTFDKEALKAIESQATGDVKITATKVETATLSEETKQLVGDRPVYNFSVTSGDKVISQFGGIVTVSVPYTPAENEDVNALVVFYINAEGKAEMVKDCVYDKATGTITFKTNHFSQYAVGYNKIEFNDVSGWYEESVIYLASRDIIKGKADGYFMPNANITRAEFVQILANMSKTDLSKYTKANFSDVNSNDWFMGAVAWANENGIASGADGKFNPNANITREDMAVMIERYVENVAKTGLAATTNSLEFSDEIEIADYAKTAVLTMQKAGIIAGKDNNEFAPKANATRAEAAKMMALVMQGLIND